MGVEAMVETVASIDAGSATLVAQKEEGASFQGLVDDAVARLDFREDVVGLDRRIRGCDPGPGAWAGLGDEPIRLLGCAIASREAPDEAPGTVLAVDETGLSLAAAGGVLRIAKVRRAGAKTPAQDSGLQPGDRLA